MFDTDITIQPPGNSREAILVYGREGAGKSAQVFSLARHTADSHFYVIDNDDAPSFNIGLETIFRDLSDRFTVAEIDRSDWESHLSQLEAWVDDAIGRSEDGEQCDDWLVVDSATPMYDSSQEWYTEQVFGKDMASFFLDARMKMEMERASAAKKGKEPGKLETFDGWKDWTVIKAQYRRFQSLVRRWPGHLWLTCEAKAVTEMDDKTLRKLYGPLGARPAGQKEIGHTTRTVMLFERSGSEWTMTTVKDRYRDLLDQETVEDFALDYLRDVGGWEEMEQAPKKDALAAARARARAKKADDGKAGE